MLEISCTFVLNGPNEVFFQIMHSFSPAWFKSTSFLSNFDFNGNYWNIYRTLENDILQFMLFHSWTANQKAHQKISLELIFLFGILDWCSAIPYCIISLQFHDISCKTTVHLNCLYWFLFQCPIELFNFPEPSQPCQHNRFPLHTVQ